LLLLSFLAAVYVPQIVLWAMSGQLHWHNSSDRVMLLFTTPLIIITGVIERVTHVHGSSWSAIVGAAVGFVSLCWIAGLVARVRGWTAVAVAAVCEVLFVFYSVSSWWIVSSILGAG
jgi:hypothetical protein